MSPQGTSRAHELPIKHETTRNVEMPQLQVKGMIGTSYKVSTGPTAVHELPLTGGSHPEQDTVRGRAATESKQDHSALIPHLLAETCRR